MIKKSVFEDDLIRGMQRELQSSEKKKYGMTHLVKAADHLQSAMEILEESGLSVQADKILNILHKIAQDNNDTVSRKGKPVLEVPELHRFINAGLFSWQDLSQMVNGSPYHRAKVNVALHQVGFSDEKIKKNLGDRFFMPYHEAHKKLKEEELATSKIEGLITETLPPASAPQPGEEIEIKTIARDEQAAHGQPRRPKNPSKISDSHTKGLTPEKMLQNMKQHGHPMNLADDGHADDLLNIDIEDRPLEVMEEGSEKTFEDSD